MYRIVPHFQSTFVLYLRNRSVLAVICWVINHCLEVICKVDQITSAEREWVTFLQLSDKQWFITHPITQKSWSISILTHWKRRKSNCILQILPTFRHWIKNPANTLDCNADVYMHCLRSWRTKTTLHRLTPWKRRLTSAKCQNDVGTASDSVARFCPVICWRINHWI